MRFRLCAILATACLCLASTASWADVGPYSQDFEGLDQADPNALAADGWLVFGNVFNSDWSYAYGYGPFPAPNGGAAFSAIDAGQGGPEQGAQQLSVYSDYNNGDHGNGKWIEANVFQERTIGAADIGSTWLFKFDAKRGNIEGRTTARAFFKTLDPATGYQLTNFIWIDMTNVPSTWGSYSLSIFIDPSLEGQIFQFGFLSTATGYEGSGVFYDNINLLRSVDLDIKPGSCPNPIQPRSRGLLPVAVLGTGDFDVNEIDIASLQLEGVGPIMSGYEDVSQPFGGDLCGCTAAGPDGYADLTLKFRAREIIDAIGALPTGDRVLTLTGVLLDGTPFEGQDCVVIIGGGGGPILPIGDSGVTSTLQSGQTSSTFNQR
jgi:hypothetical protein